MATAILHKLHLSSERLRQLSGHERHTFALAGHVFNEPMTLLKLVQMCQPSPDAHSFEQDAGVSQALFMLKMLVAKTHEALDALNRPAVHATLLAEYFAPVDGVTEDWELARQQLAAMDWTRSIRNSRSFHYMSQGQWAPFLGDEDCEGAYAIVGETHGNTLFYWSEARAAVATFDRVNTTDPIQGLATMLDELGALLNLVTSSLAKGMQHYMYAHLTEDGALEDAVHLEAPTLSSMTIPYFLSK